MSGICTRYNSPAAAGKVNSPPQFSIYNSPFSISYPPSPLYSIVDSFSPRAIDLSQKNGRAGKSPGAAEVLRVVPGLGNPW
jgi:hypothetical protein